LNAANDHKIALSAQYKQMIETKEERFKIWITNIPTNYDDDREDFGVQRTSFLFIFSAHKNCGDIIGRIRSTSENVEIFITLAGATARRLYFSLGSLTIGRSIIPLL